MTEQTHAIENGAARRLERSRSDRMVAGVCGGLANYFDIHPAFYRVGFVVLTLLGGAGILIYATAALVLPDEGKEDSVATAILRNRRDRPWPLIGLALVGVAIASLLARATLWPHGDAWFLLLVAGGAILWVTRHSGGTATAAADAPTVAREDSRQMRRLFKGSLIALGTIIALVLVAAAICAAVFHVNLSNGVGDRRYVVADRQDLNHEYKLGIGNLTVNLRHVVFGTGETGVRARVDIGELRVIVPRNVGLRIRGDAQLGQVEVLGETSDGRDVHQKVAMGGRRTRTTTKRILVLDAHVGIGKVLVIREPRRGLR
jgi:phage shock protein PspC (stress-responsive transcriptional regulator)